MKRIPYILALLATAVVASAQTATEQIASLKARLTANATKIAALQARISTAKQVGAKLSFDTNKLVTDAYNREATLKSTATRESVIENKTKFLKVLGTDLIITGANLQILNGKDGIGNGVGNLIIGFNPLREVGNDRSGSHNLVLGQYNNYSGNYGIVAGETNSLYASHSAVLGGRLNRVDGGDFFQVIANGTRNSTTGNAAVILSGEDNRVFGVRGVIFAGRNNEIGGGNDSVIVTGSNNRISSSAYSVIATGLGNRIENTSYSGIATGKNYLLKTAYTFWEK